jgi:hypothetical protein
MRLDKPQPNTPGNLEDLIGHIRRRQSGATATSRSGPGRGPPWRAWPAQVPRELRDRFRELWALLSLVGPQAQEREAEVGRVVEDCGRKLKRRRKG